MKRLLIPVALCGLLVSSPTAPSAQAKKSNSSQISVIGIRSLDRVFRDARQLDSTIISAQQTRRSGRQGLNSVLGLNPRSTFEDGLRELRERGNGKLRVASRGGVPTIQSSDAVPSGVRSGVSKANAAISDYHRLLTDLVDLPSDSRALVRSARQLSLADLRSESTIQSIRDISTRIQQVRQFRANVDTIQALPSKSQRLMTSLQGDVGAVTRVFPSR